ncbi:hypothetical protein EYC84_009816 [Monilinia fructicola]|uniref:Uncharacterized protein n=1 Tax=Monilinia fructicola TaxID=38448 RepID=A0A5M9JEA4_MONFR|nr:hypothetical protein EYC84_009816 [Monilinia fructicola]
MQRVTDEKHLVSLFAAYQRYVGIQIPSSLINLLDEEMSFLPFLSYPVPSIQITFYPCMPYPVSLIPNFHRVPVPPDSLATIEMICGGYAMRNAQIARWAVVFQ